MLDTRASPHRILPRWDEYKEIISGLVDIARMWLFPRNDCSLYGLAVINDKWSYANEHKTVTKMKDWTDYCLIRFTCATVLAVCISRTYQCEMSDVLSILHFPFPAFLTFPGRVTYCSIQLEFISYSLMARRLNNQIMQTIKCTNSASQQFKLVWRTDRQTDGRAELR